MIKKRVFGAGVLLAAMSSAPALAIDGFAVEAGRGEGVDRGRVAVQWDWNRQLLTFGNWHVGGFWDLSLGVWHDGDARAGQNDSIVDVGFTPVFRIQPNALVGPYLEAAVGVHVLSRSQIGDKRMSTMFQFGDHVGLGYRFGKTGFDLGYRFQHHSNASIKRPNPGINFHQVRLQYRF